MLRLEFPGAIYHVTARGNERRALVRDDGDRRRFAACLGECVTGQRVRLYLFCRVDRGGILRRQRGTLTRAIAARWLGVFAGLRQREVAPVLGMTTGAAASAAVRVLARRTSEDPALAKHLAAAEALLNLRVEQRQP